MHDVFVGRQPIYSRQLGVVAYELLFRTGGANDAQGLDGERATSQVALNAFLELGLDAIVGRKRAFINLTRAFILNDFAAAFPAERVVLEVLEGLPIDGSFLDALRGLAGRGYTIALDDFEYRDDTAPLLDVADIVKLDVLALGHPGLLDTVERLRRHDLKLLAEKIETHEDFALCRELGFDFYQGYFFCQPDVVRGQRSPANRLAVMRLLATLQNPTIEFHELEEIIVQDVSLSYKLLRLINSAFYARPQRVQSIRQGLMLLGTRRITTWASLIAMSGITDKPQELMVTALVRARMCELLAEARGDAGSEGFFSVGLLSVLDALLDAPMPEILKSLPLAEDIECGILFQEGIAGETLHCVLAYERGRWDEVRLEGISRGAITDAYLNAISWAADVTSTLAI